MNIRGAVTVLLCCIPGLATFAGNPFFNTYTKKMEPGAWELEAGVDALHAPSSPWTTGQSVELEHGFNEHAAAGVYLLGTKAPGCSWRLDGFKLETRYRPWLNRSFFVPAFYLEYEQFAHHETYRDAIAGFSEPDDTEGGTEHELEMRLLFSRDFSWGNVALNLIGEKALSPEPTGLGYAAGVSLKASELRPRQSSPDTDEDADSATLIGLEVFGGLGSSNNMALDTRRQEHYLQPFISIPVSRRVALKTAVAVGLTGRSGTIVRVALKIELGD